MVVEEHISKPQAREVILGRHAPRENNPVCGYAVALCAGEQIFRSPFVVVQEPQHAVGRPVQNSHPALEHRRVQLVDVVERGEDKFVFGEIVLRPCCGGSDFTFCVARQETVGQVKRPFPEQVRERRRKRKLVCDDVVDVW